MVSAAERPVKMAAMRNVHPTWVTVLQCHSCIVGASETNIRQTTTVTRLAFFHNVN